MFSSRTATGVDDSATSSPLRNLGLLTLASLGVVYGDIGTSPLYALRVAIEFVSGRKQPDTESVLGVLSLILWALIICVTLKYILVLLRANNRGEGGTLALMALARAAKYPTLLFIGIIGTSFFWGDIAITPAISVLSAVEGWDVATPALHEYVVPLSIVILVVLFALQSRGTLAIGRLFAPVMALWFVVIGIAGAAQIAHDPRALVALNPLHGIRLVSSLGVMGLVVPGAVFLAVAGAEATYAALGHFGRRPIQLAWFSLVLPALAVNYTGQATLLLTNSKAIENPFFLLVPDWALIPMVVLAMLASVVASQAVISAAFSVARQSVQLGLLPRLAIRHTSNMVSGQIFVPIVNNILFVAVLLVVVIFRHSSGLASVYGISLSGAMVADTLLVFFVFWKTWCLPLAAAIAICAFLLCIDLPFFFSNLFKIVEGGWLLVAIAFSLLIITLTWLRGSKALSDSMYDRERDLVWLRRQLEHRSIVRIAGAAVYLTRNASGAPPALVHNVRYMQVLHDANILMSIKATDSPRVPDSERVQIEKLSNDFTHITLTYGFLESPNVPGALALCGKRGLNIDANSSVFFLSPRRLQLSGHSSLPRWQGRLFLWLSRNSLDIVQFFNLPVDRVIKIRSQAAI